MSTVVSTIISIVVGFFIALLFFYLGKRRKYASKLGYSLLSRSRVLVRDALMNENFTLQFKGEGILRDLYYVELLLFNTEPSDICAPKGEEPVSFQLLKDSAWKWLQVKEVSPGINAEITIREEDKKYADLNFQSLKNNEKILIKGLIESGEDIVDRMDSCLKVSTRIMNVDPKIESMEFISELDHKRALKMFYPCFAVALYGIICVVGFLFFPYKFSINLGYFMMGTLVLFSATLLVYAVILYLRIRPYRFMKRIMDTESVESKKK